MRIYVASAWSDFRVARAAQNMLRALGHVITCDWTRDADAIGECASAPEHVRFQAALDDEAGVLGADAFLLCAPATGGSGCWTELGLARAARRFRHDYMVAVCGPGRDRNVFALLADYRGETVEDAVEWLHGGGAR